MKVSLLILNDLPPVTIKHSVSKAQKFCHHIETGVEKPVEEHQPDEQIGHLSESNITNFHILKPSFCLKTDCLL